MRKRLLTIIMSAASLLAATAQNAGDYIYANKGRYKITTGENLLPNGDFSMGYDGWTTDGGNALSLDTFNLVSNAPDGNYFMCVNHKEDGPGKGSAIVRRMQVEPGTYYISYKVRAEEEVTTTIADGKNYQNIFFNQDASLTAMQQIAKAQTYGTEWKTVEYCAEIPAPGYLVFYIHSTYMGTCFDEFKVMEAKQVANDRDINAMIKRLEDLMANPLFPNEHEILLAAIEELKSLYDSEEVILVEEMLSIVETEAIGTFLDANTINVSQYLQCPDFDSATPSNNQQTNIGGWTTEGGRWLVRAAAGPFRSTYIERNYPGSGVIPEGRIYQTTNMLPAGKYMFTMKGNARRYRSKKNDIWEDFEIRGIKVFINNDSTECFPIDTAKVNAYTVYSDVKEGETITIGLYVPDSVANLVNFDNTELRVIGVSQEQIDAHFAAQELVNAKTELQAKIDEARQLLVSELYFYGKPTLTDSINKSQKVHDESLITDSVTNQTKRMTRAITAYKDVNAEYTALMGDMDTVEALLADESFKNGKQELSAALQTAEDYVKTLDAAVPDSAGLAQQSQLLIKAVTAFMLANTDVDEAYNFSEWATSEDAGYMPEFSADAITTSDGSALYVDNGLFCGNSTKSRLAFLTANTNIQADPEHGLSVNLSKKNLTVMSVLNLKQGDVVTLDWAMKTASHGLYITSANATYTAADGTVKELNVAGKKDANKLDIKDNSNGLGGKTRHVFTMTADGTLDLYFGSSNSTLLVSYIGIKYADPTGITQPNQPGEVYNGAVYNLNGQRVATGKERIATLPQGIYIINGKKIVVR